MDTTKILKNAWNMMLHYRALWLFGVILALTSISFGSSLWLRDHEEVADRTLVNWNMSAKDQAWVKENFGLNLPRSYTLKVEDLSIQLDDPTLSPQQRTHLLRIVVGVTAALLILLVFVLVLRYTSGAALISMVNDRQYNDQKYGAGKGWSLGFSINAVKLFLLDLLVIPLLLTFTVLIFLPAMLPVLIAITGTPAGITIGILLMVTLTLVSVAALIVMWIAGLVALQLAYRACCLEGLGVFAALWRSFRVMRSHLQGVGLTWVIIAGLDLLYPLLAAPVAILLIAAGLLTGGSLALILGSLLALVAAKATAWTIAVITGIVLLVLVIAIPMALLGGLREVFTSATWTLTFGEATRQQSAEGVSAPQPAISQAGTA